MKKSSCLLVCLAVTYWVSMAIAAPRRGPREDPNLKAVLELIEEYKNKSTTIQTDPYLDNVHAFSQGPGRCADTFFCVVHGILHKHRNASRQAHLSPKIESNLNIYIRSKNISCSEVLKTLNTTVWLEPSDFLSDIKKCIHCRNLNLTKPSC